jgi:very-short-patch-repair endonuclease
MVDGIPVTSVARTLLDLGALLPPTQLQRVYEQAERLRILDVRAIEELLLRSNGRRGVAPLRTLTDYDPTVAVDSKSELEARFLDLIRHARIPIPQLNVLVAGFEVDAYWPDVGLVVELQGYRDHSRRVTFERDHRKLAALKLAGCEVVPLTWQQVVGQGRYVAELIRSLRARRGPFDPQSVL